MTTIGACRVKAKPAQPTSELEAEGMTLNDAFAGGLPGAVGVGDVGLEFLPLAVAPGPVWLPVTPACAAKPPPAVAGPCRATN